jgi:hypothetical protein
MIVIYRLETVNNSPKFIKYDKWDGKFHYSLSGLKLNKDEIIKKFNTTYYRTSEI